MRLMVFYDLPVLKRSEKKAYARFHKFLLRNGYDMLQYSIYARVCNGPESVEKHTARLRANLPSAGSIRCMQVTEKQYAAIQILVGEKTEKDKPKYARQLSFF